MPAFADDVRRSEQKQASKIWKALVEGGSSATRMAEALLPENPDHLTAQQLSDIQAAKKELQKRKARELTTMLVQNSKPLLAREPRHVLVDTVAELQVLGGLPQCPVCYLAHAAMC